MFLGLFAVDHWLNIPEGLRGTAYRVFYWSGAGLGLGMLVGAPRAIPLALQRLDVVNVLNGAMISGQSLLAVGLIAKGYSVEYVVAGQVGINLAGFVAYLGAARRLLPNWGKPVWDGSVVRKLLRFGGWISVGGIVVPMLLHIEKLFLGRLLSTAAVAYYSVPYNLISRLAVGASAIGGALFPFFSRLQVTDLGVVREANLRISRVIVLLLWPLVLLLTFWGSDLLNVWMGPSYAENGAMALALLAWATLINAAAWSPFTFLQTSGRPDIPAKFNIVEFFLYVPLAWQLTSWLGINGAALAYLFRMLLDTILLFVAVAHLYEVQWKAWFQSLVRPMGASLVGVLLVWGASEGALSAAPSLWRLAAGVVGVGLVSGAVLWKWLTTQPEYAILQEVARPFLDRVKSN